MIFFVVILPLLALARKYAASLAAQNLIDTILICIYRSAVPLMMSNNIIGEGGRTNSDIFKPGLLNFQSHNFSTNYVGFKMNMK